MPRHSLVPHHLSMTTDKPPSSFMQEPELGAEELPSTENTSHEALLATEGPEGPSVTHRTFVPMPPICSDSTVHSEPVSHPSRTAGLLSPDHPSDEDAKSTESIFLTQVLVPSCLHLWLQCSQVPAPSYLHCCGLSRTGRAALRHSLVVVVVVLWHRQHLRSPWDVVLTSVQRPVTTVPHFSCCPGSWEQRWL